MDVSGVSLVGKSAWNPFFSSRFPLATCLRFIKSVTDQISTLTLGLLGRNLRWGLAYMYNEFNYVAEGCLPCLPYGEKCMEAILFH